METPSLLLRALSAIMVIVAVINSSAAWASELSRFTETTPPGFEDLAAEREVLLDVYVGGRKLGDVRAVVVPGFVTFKDPRSIVSLIPDVAQTERLVTALSGPLPANASSVCGITKEDGCGFLRPDRVGVILDEGRFRIDIFVHPDFLNQPDPSATHYLPRPENQPSLVSLFGSTFSDLGGGKRSWHLQNRSVASIGNFRVRSDTAVTRGLGLTIDNLTVETDHRDWRFVSGIFWAPGSELIGRRRIIGIGAATQLDTRLNKTELLGTPVEVFLQQAAQVEVLINGRIASSRIYPPGNRLIETAALPNGTYDIVLRIKEEGRPVREEQRFFTKGAAMAPIGRPLFSGFVGMLPSSDSGMSLDNAMLFYEATAAFRLSPSIGLDAAILGSARKVLFESGAVFHNRRAQVRLGTLVSTAGDFGIALRATTVGNGPASLTFDLRKISSRDGQPLLPTSNSRGTFSEETKPGFADLGSYTQALSIFSYRFSHATFRLTSLYRKNGKDEANYSVGASVELPVVRSRRWDFVLSASAQKTDQDITSFLGFRFLANRGNAAFSGSAGISTQTARGAKSSQLVGEVQTAWQQTLGGSRLSTDVAIGQNSDGAYSRASAQMQSSAFNGRADMLQQFGDNRTTQFSATVDTAIVVTKSGVGIAGREMNDTGVMVRIAGHGEEQKFDVLINDVIRGTVTNRKRLLIFLQPYQTYSVRLRPREISGFDSTPRSVTLYPGNVTELEWEAVPLFILFGKAVTTEGRPLINAEISSAYGLSRTDGEGYFQVETKLNDQLKVSRQTNMICTISINVARPIDGFVSGGEQICRP